ncbi:hypothetical protein ACSBR2_000975 [Camellia fascicularis]
MNSPSVDAACRKIDNLAEENQLDLALVLMITKAWSAAKESSMMKDERLMPKEIRIVKYLLTIEDPEEQLCTLKDAFTPREELEGKDVDCLYTIFHHENNNPLSLVLIESALRDINLLVLVLFPLIWVLFMYFLNLKMDGDTNRTPEKLHTWIKVVVDAYHFSREGTLIKEARDLMNPKIIKRLEELKKLVQDKFM